MPKFSVIVPVYNAEKYIKQCVCSLVNQQYGNYEIILVNDCSTDTSLELCNSFARQYTNVVVINQPQNKGVSAARNKGIEVAKGDYILFVDSDDFVSEDYFETLETLIVEEYDLISFGNYDYLIDGDGSTETKLSDMNYDVSCNDTSPWNKLFLKIEEYDLISFGNYDYLIDGDGSTETKLSDMNYDVSCNDTSPWNKLFLKTFFASPWNKLFLKKTLLHYNIRFDESCVCYEDYLFNVEYCKHISTFKTTVTSPWNKLFLKKTLLHYNIRFDESCVCYEDYLFNVEYCKHISTFKTTVKPLYYYRQFTNVNHVSKRKWGKQFQISRKVAAKTDEIIASKREVEDLSEIRRYVYKAYLVELEASKASNKGYRDSMKELLRDINFIKAVNSINPCGTKLTLFKILHKMNLTLGCKFIIESLL